MHSRRQIAGMLGAGLGAGLLLPAPARAIYAQQSSGSRLPSAEDYVPPDTLGTTEDLFRRMTAPVRLDDQGPFPFVVDTGANQTVISDVLAASLGLPRGEPAALHGVAGVQVADTVRAARLEVGGRVERDVVLSVLPQAALGGPGLLGVDRFDGGSLTLDFQARRLEIASRAARRRPSDVTVRAVQRGGRLTIVDADLAGVPVSAFLDTGAQRSIGNGALRAMAAQAAGAALWSRTTILSATGQTIVGEFAILPAMRLGGLRFNDVPVAFADLHIFRLWDLEDRPAMLLGVDVLSRFPFVALDFARAEVRFRLPQRS